MARKIIDIGVVGNDGTGDSIRDSFRKVNDNFRELYSSLGLGEKLTFIGLDDTPEKFVGYENNILTVGAVPGGPDGLGIKFKPILEGTGVSINQTADSITVSALFAAIQGDKAPQLGGPLITSSGATRYPIGNLPDLRSTSEVSTAVSKITTTHGVLNADHDRLAANKGYVDSKIARAGVDAIDPKTGTNNPDWGRMTGPLILSRDPEPGDDDTYDGLIAATKRYVDNSAFGSAVNLYVATSGADERPGVSLALQGRALAYAYRSIEAALKRAEEIMLESRVEMGPYKKVLTYGNGDGVCTLTSIGVAPDSGSGFTPTAGAIVYMSVDTIELSASSSDFNYRAGDVISLAPGVGTKAQIEILAVNSRGEILSFRLITPGVYSVLPGGYTIPTLPGTSAFGGGATFDVTYKVNSVYIPPGGIGTGYGLVSVRIERGVGDTTGSGAFGTAEVVGGKIISITVTDQGSNFTNTPILTVNLPRFKIFTNGARTDFTGNVTSTTATAIRTRDIRDGLYLRGEESGALAQILAHKGELDGLDEVFDVDIKYGAFIPGEVISYGDVTKLTQISVLIETGTYEENYPLKVPQNVAVIGDEFRRVIIKPKVGISSSPWAFQQFKRDLEIDGNITAEQEFGWHYLADTSKPVYPLIDNKGYYRSAARLLELNKFFIQDEITAWIAHQIDTAVTGSIWDGFDYNVKLCARDVGLIVDAYTFDLRWGGYNRTVSAALKYQGSASGLKAIGPLQLANTEEAINYVNTLAQQIITNTAIPTVYNTIRSQIIDFAYVAETGSGDVITALKNVVIDFINGSATGAAVPNFPKDNNDLDVFLCNDAVIIRAVTCQGHGGFMMVLDPEGQILAKSPYAQECASFSRSNGKKRFSGGMYVDGFTGNLKFEIYDKASYAAGTFVIGNSYTIKTVGTTDFTIIGATSNTVGLSFTATGAGIGDGTAYSNQFLRVRGLTRYPNLPASFIVEDTVYRINYVRDYIYSPTGSTASFILDETTPWTTPIFTYDSTICSRDVGLIVDGLSYDVVLGTNYNQRKAGLTYRQNNAHVVIESQLSYTISAIQRTHDLVNAEIPDAAYATSRAAVELSKTNIVNILRNGTIAAAPVSFTNPPGLSTDLSNAKTLLLSNIDYIKDQTVGWIAAQVSGNISPFTTAYTYDEYSCARDIGLIIEATIYNLIYGGNNAIVDAGLKYYDGVGSATTAQLPVGQVATTVAAIDYAKYLAKRVVQNLAPATSYSSTTRTTGTAAGGTVPNDVEALIAVVSTIVNAGTYGGSITTPSFTAYSYDSNKKLAVAEFTATPVKTAIQADIITYVNSIANRYEVLMPGNRSMLANDFTQVNDMGYALVTNNGGLLEAVSVFTYYCYISYYSRNGGQIRSVAGSSAHGKYALVAEGADPLEIPTPVTLYQDLATGATVVSTGIYINSAGGLIVYINNYSFVPLNNGEFEVIHTDGNLYRYSVTSVATTDLPAGYAQLNISSTGNSTTAGLAYAIPDGTIVTIRALSQVALTGDIVDVATRPSTALKLNETEPVYRVLQFQAYTDPNGQQTCTISVANPTSITAVGHGQLPGYIVRFSSTGTLPTGITAGVKYYILDTGITANSFRIALTKNGNPIAVTAAGSGTHSFNPAGLARTTLRENYDYVELVPWSPNEYRGSTFTFTVSSPATAPLFTTTGSHGFSAGDIIGFSTTGVLPSGITDTRNYFVLASGLSSTEFRVSATPGGTAVDTAGSQSGVHTVGKVRGYALDDSFAIVALSAADKARVVGMKVVYIGEEYTVTQYDDETATGEPFGRIYFDRGLVDDILTYSSPPTLKGGVPRRTNASTGTLTIRISLTRVTGHDLLEIGTGSYADTNYPNEIYGGAVNPLDEDAEVEERGSGRTFYVTTDQFGNFRVGPYFRVDQGTGKVTFSAAIALSNLDGLGFKRGVPISEFSPDASMANNATDTVPTQNAVRTYIERRLGVSHDGNALSDNTQIIPPIIGGFMALNGVTVMNENMDLGNHKIINVKDPVLPTDAVNLESLTWDNFQDFTGTNMDGGDLLVFTGIGNTSVNATAVGDVTFNLRAGTDSSLNQIDVQIASNTIVNSDINANAAIDQAKLNLDSSYATTVTSLSTTATGTGAIDFLASISGTTLTILTSGPSGTLVQAGQQITGGVVPANTYIVANISGVGLGSTWQLNNTVTQPSTILTASLVTLTFTAQTTAPFATGQRIVVSGLSISGYNGVQTVIGCTPTEVTYGGTTTGSATGGTVKALRGVSTFDTTQFTVTDGFVTVKSNGVLASRIEKIATKTVLGNSAAITDNVTAVPFTTVVNDGGAVKKSQYSSTGFLRKVASTGIEGTDYTMIEATTGAVGYAAGDASKLVVRSSSGDIGARILTLDGNDGSGQGLKLKMPAESTATLTLARTSTVTGGSTRLYGFSGNAAILIGNGSLASDATTYYDNDAHTFRKIDGVTPGILTAGSIQLTTITTGGPTTTGTIIGRWSLSGTGSRMQATYSADLAEYYEGDKEYEVGTVLVFGGEKEVTISNTREDYRIAGVVSDTAAYSMYGACPGLKNLIALQGRVPVKVVGKITKGDLLTTSSIAGVAVSAGGNAKTGTVIGKALEDYNSDHVGTIQVAVGRT